MLATTAPVHDDLRDRDHRTGLTLRLRLLVRSGAVLITAVPTGTFLLCVWLVAAVLAPLTLLVWALPPVTALVRRYATAHRRSAARVLDAPVPATYRVVGGGVFRRATTILRDPASWRDALWLFVHAVVGSTLAALQVALFLGGVFYLVYPFLYWVTPQAAFGRPFGFFELHSVAQACGVMPLAVVAFLLWYGISLPLARGEARLTRGMLGA